MAKCAYEPSQPSGIPYDTKTIPRFLSWCSRAWQVGFLLSPAPKTRVKERIEYSPPLEVDGADWIHKNPTEKKQTVNILAKDSCRETDSTIYVQKDEPGTSDEGEELPDGKEKHYTLEAPAKERIWIWCLGESGKCSARIQALPPN